jgi:ornithine decarboxylase
LPSTDAVYALEGKFGVAADKAGALLRAAGQITPKVGITFHVGSQCMDPVAFRDALRFVRDLVDAEGVDLKRF